MNIRPLYKTANLLGQVYRILSTSLLLAALFKHRRRDTK